MTVRFAAEHAAYASDEYELTGARSVFQAVAWAEAHAGPDRTYVLYVRTVDRALIRLAGVHSTDPEQVSAANQSP